MFDVVEKEKLLDAINIDLKFMDDKRYRDINGGHLKPVLDNIERIWKSPNRILLEVINLVIPGENDKTNDFKEISDFLYQVSPDIPLHFSRFYPQYKMSNKKPTDLRKLVEAKKIAESTGLRYVYIGNTQIPDANNTYCPNCKYLLIERYGYNISKNVFRNYPKDKKPICPQCGFEINIVI